MSVKVKLRIADLIVQIQSAFPLVEMTKKEKIKEFVQLFDNFIYWGEKKAQIVIDLRFVDQLPELKSTKDTFITRYHQKKRESWRITPQGRHYIYQSPLKDGEAAAFIDKRFSRAIFYLLPRKDKGKAWKIADVSYNFLQILMINYLALRKLGIFAHGLGIHDRGQKGRLFCGKSQAGKSTSAKIWFKHSRAMVLNDDRVIVRKINKRFFIYSSPWPGEFRENFRSCLKPAPLKQLFFIYHARKNIVARIDPALAFGLLYSNTFLAFWNKQCLENTIAFCDQLINEVPCYNLGFVNDKKIIKFVRSIDSRTGHERTAV